MLVACKESPNKVEESNTIATTAVEKKEIKTVIEEAKTPILDTVSEIVPDELKIETVNDIKTEVEAVVSEKKSKAVKTETSKPISEIKEKVETKEKEANKVVIEKEEKIVKAVEPAKKEIIKKVAAVSNETWNNLLKKHVDSKGNVSYDNFKKDEKVLQSYLDFLAKNKPASSTSKNEKLAYYINLYNASTVKLILNNYPIGSIKDIKGPWDKKWVKVGNEE